MRSVESPPTLLLAGGGLANSLIAYRLAQRRPDVKTIIVESGVRLGGRHTWSFFSSDLTDEARWIDPFIVRRWDRYEVRFPKGRRVIETGYRSVTSDRLHEVVAGAAGMQIMLGADVIALDRGGATLADGRRLTADAVIDGRGPAAMPDLVLGFQKFLGQMVRLSEPHGIDHPIVMDATVHQMDGYRFLYVLPWDSRTLLIEDTRYSDGPGLDHLALRRSIEVYAEAHGWTIEHIEAEEEGVLPVALEGDVEAYWRRASGMALSGLRAVLFHPTTGYSLPDAVALAEDICNLPVIDSASVEVLARERSIRLWRERSFFRLLNRMLFRAAEPSKRYRVLERFYRLSEPLIRRFYAADLTRMDQMRLVTGKPPVPFGAALQCLVENKPR